MVKAMKIYNEERNLKQLILFGAGKNGKLALERYGKEKVAYFCDNNRELQGSLVEGIAVVSFEKMVLLHAEGYLIMVTPASYVLMIGQLEREGIKDYLIFHPDKASNYMEELELRENVFADHNKELDELVKVYAGTDLLEDTSMLKMASAKAIKRSKENGLILSRLGYNEEGSYYGNCNVILEYAGIPSEEVKYFPMVSHNQGWPQFYILFEYRSAVIFSGTYYRSKIHERFPYVPVFSVGPYIHYAKGIYDKERVVSEKKKNGNTLLIFLPHGTEMVEREYSRERFIDEIIERYDDQFDTFFMCVYWADINHDVCKYAEERGIHVVSAGLRFDSNFDNRLKTILELSDAVVCGDLGSFVFYALYMGKPVARVDLTDNRTIPEIEYKSKLERSIQNTEDEKIFLERFRQLFDEKFKFNQEQMQWAGEVNGFQQIRSADYLREIYDISKDIWNCCHGDISDYPEAVRRVYRNYDRRSDISKMHILKTAVGNYVE